MRWTLELVTEVTSPNCMFCDTSCTLFPQQRADADDRCTFADCDFKVAAHAHREFVERDALWRVRFQSVAQFAQRGEISGGDGWRHLPAPPSSSDPRIATCG